MRSLLLLEEAYLRLEVRVVRVRHADYLDAVSVVVHHSLHHGARMLALHHARRSLRTLRCTKDTAAGFCSSNTILRIIRMHLGRNQVRLSALVPRCSVLAKAAISLAIALIVHRQQLRVRVGQGAHASRVMPSTLHGRRIVNVSSVGSLMMRLRVVYALVDVAHTLTMDSLFVQLRLDGG